MKTYLLDVECTDENTDDIAKAVHYSLRQIFRNNADVPAIIYGQCTDSGSTETGQALFCAFESLGISSELYLITNCSLHNLQTALWNSVQLVLGRGLDNENKGKLNTTQLSHGVYNIKNWHKHNKLKEIYLYTQSEERKEEKIQI